MIASPARVGASIWASSTQTSGARRAPSSSHAGGGKVARDSATSKRSPRSATASPRSRTTFGLRSPGHAERADGDPEEAHPLLERLDERDLEVVARIASGRPGAPAPLPTSTTRARSGIPRGELERVGEHQVDELGVTARGGEIDLGVERRDAIDERGEARSRGGEARGRGKRCADLGVEVRGLSHGCFQPVF